MYHTISKYALLLVMIALLASDCDSTTDPIPGQALFKRLAFTADHVQYDFNFEAEQKPGTLAINKSTPTNLANAMQAGSGYSLVVDGKTYRISYRESNHTVFMTLTLPEDVTTLPTSITFNTLSVSDNAKLVDQKGDDITTEKDLTITEGTFTVKITSEDDKKTTLYNIQLKLNENTPQTPTITKLVLLRSLADADEKDLNVDLTTMSVTIPVDATIPTQAFIKELQTSPEGLKVVETRNTETLSENSELTIKDGKLFLSIPSQNGPVTNYVIEIVKEAQQGAILTSITLDYLGDNSPEDDIVLEEVTALVSLNRGLRLKKSVRIHSYQLADNSKEATVSLSSDANGDLSTASPTEVMLSDDNQLKLYVTPSGGATSTEYTLTFRENLYRGNSLTSVQIGYGGTDVPVSFIGVGDEKQKTIMLDQGLLDQVTIKDVVVSEGATVEVGEDMIPAGQETTIDFDGNQIIVKVTSQSGESIDYKIIFNLQNILKSLFLEVEGETVELKGKAGEPSTWIGEIEFYNAFTGNDPVRIETLELSDGNKARIKKDAGYEEIMSKGSITLPESSTRPNEFTATLEVYVEGDDMDKETYTLIIRKKSLMMKSYSQQILGTEIPPLGIALLDTLKDPNDKNSFYDYNVLTISGLEKKATNYRLSIGDEIFDKDIMSTADGELFLMKRDFMPDTETDPAILTKEVEVEDIKLLSTGDASSEIATIAKYEKSKIRDWKDLQGMRIDLEVSYTLENDIALPNPGEGGLAKEGFEPIGNGLTAFTGSFDGESRMISKFSINRPEKDSVGLFGYIVSESTAVKDVKIAILDSVHGRNNVGGVVGYFQSGTITGVEVTGGKVSGNNQVGGVAGDNNEGTITNCYATGNVEGNYSRVGGVAGYNYGKITNCYATGNVEGNNRVGGVAGDNYGKITNCYATGDVSGTSSIGGVAGNNDQGGTITNCYATGNVEGNNLVGGVAGETFYLGLINCYATGNVSGNKDVGGVTGRISGAAKVICYSLGSVSRRDQDASNEPTLNWVVGFIDGSPQINSYYPDRGEKSPTADKLISIPGVNPVTKSEFGNLKKISSPAGINEGDPFKDWDFTTDGDWEWTQETDILYWPFLRVATGDGIPMASQAFRDGFKEAQEAGQQVALKALQDTMGDDWQ